MEDNFFELVSSQMAKVSESLKKEFSAIRSNRVSANFLDNVKVNCYGQDVPISNVASISILDSSTLVANVWEQGNVANVDAGIRSANLGLNPRVEGNKLFIAFPPLTQERRNDLIKLCKKKLEERKISLRNIRRDNNEKLKKEQKEGLLSEDELKKANDEIQKLTDETIATLEQIFSTKKQDLETV